MQQYTVTGMHCAACSASVEKAVKKVPGVTSCAVSLLTNSMGVEGTAEPAAIINAVEDAGYGASMRGQEAAPAADASALEDRRRGGVLWVERLRAVCHDGRAAPRRQRSRHGVYGRILF